MKKLMLLVAVATFAIGTAAYAGGNDKNAEKKACCKSGGGKAESKSCHGKEEKAMDKTSNSDAKSEKSASKSETAK